MIGGRCDLALSLFIVTEKGFILFVLSISTLNVTVKQWRHSSYSTAITNCVYCLTQSLTPSPKKQMLPVRLNQMSLKTKYRYSRTMLSDIYIHTVYSTPATRRAEFSIRFVASLRSLSCVSCELSICKFRSLLVEFTPRLLSTWPSKHCQFRRKPTKMQPGFEDCVSMYSLVPTHMILSTRASNGKYRTSELFSSLGEVLAKLEESHTKSEFGCQSRGVQ
jgi:hypothetical protein